MPGGPDQEDALGDAGTQPAIGLRVFQEVDDLEQLVLGLVDPGDIGEGHLGVGLHIDLGLGLADLHQPAEALLVGDAADHEEPKADDQGDREQPGKQIAQQRALDLAGKADIVRLQPIGHIELDPRRAKELGTALGRPRELALDEAVGDAHLLDRTVLQQRLELAIRDRLDLPLGDLPALENQEQEERQEGIAVIDLLLLLHQPSLPRPREALALSYT